MNRVYKIIESAPAPSLCINATIKTLPYNVWRDISSLAYSSMDLSDYNFGEYEIYKFSNRKQLDKAAAVLKGAMFSEVGSDEWQEMIDASLTDK